MPVQRGPRFLPDSRHKDERTPDAMRWNLVNGSHFFLGMWYATD
jgi:hypothetical protein